MTLDEAIKHYQQVAEESNFEQAMEHKQLAQWLQELKKFKKMQTTEEWLQNTTFEELAEAIYEWYTKGYTRGKLKVNPHPITEIMKWLKEPKEEKHNG